MALLLLHDRTSTLMADAAEIEGFNRFLDRYVRALPLEETAIRYRENLIDEYMNENAVLENGVRSWEDRLGGAFQQKYKNYMNYLVSYYSFRGGAHGIQTLSNIVFDSKTGLQVREQDLFAPGYEEPVAQLLRLEVKSSMEQEDPELMQLVNLVQDGKPVKVTMSNGNEEVIAFVGVYDPLTLKANDRNKLFFGNDSRLYWPSEDVPVYADFAYFQLYNTTYTNVVIR
jgi:hypothetical protein